MEREEDEYSDLFGGEKEVGEVSEQKYRVMGYVEGLEKGKEVSIQNSFNAGFKEGALLSISLNFVNDVLEFLLEQKVLSEQEIKEATRLKKRTETLWSGIFESKTSLRTQTVALVSDCINFEREIKEREESGGERYLLFSSISSLL